MHKKYRRYYKIGDITIQVQADLPITDTTFEPKFKLFEVDGSGEGAINIRHHFSSFPFNSKALGKAICCNQKSADEEVFGKPRLAIYKKRGYWVYLGMPPGRATVFSGDHTNAHIYHKKDWEQSFLGGNHSSLSLFTSDQIILARILADRHGCMMHSCGASLNGKGFLFVGHSSAGKSTMATMLRGEAKILCDDRIILRGSSKTVKQKALSTLRIFGTWFHGDVSDISADSAPLRGIFFLRKASRNYLVRLKSKNEIVKSLLSCVIKPLITKDWWERTLAFIDKVSGAVPCYDLYFDRSGAVVELLKRV